MDRTCGNCKFFCRHYIKLNGNYCDINSGHCFFPRIKWRDDNRAACDHWQEAELLTDECGEQADT